MGLFKRKDIEERSLSYNALIESLNSNKVYINKESVLKLPIIAESVQRICGTIASLPLELMVKEKDRNNIIEDDIRLYLLNVEANSYLTSYNLKYRICEDLLLFGKSYCYIERTGVKLKALHPIKYTTVTEKNIVDKNGVIVDKSFQYVLNNIVQNRNAYDILVIDTSSKGVLNSNKLLTLLINHSEMLDNIIQNMSMPSGYLKTEGRLTQNTINKMRESWKNIYSGPKNIARTVILEEGLSYHPLEMDLNKFQNNETKAAFIEDAQRLFGLFNVKSDSDYLKYCINPLISCIENALTSQLLLTFEKEKNTKFIFNTEEVIKASEIERVEAVSMAVKSGLITIGEGRRRLNENSFFINDDDFLLLSQGYIHAYKDRIICPNSSSIINLTDEQVTKKGENNNASDL